jgi:hypothetical protein
VGDEARAARLAASAIRRFVRYLELMRAREGETSEVLDIRVEVDSVVAEDSGPDDVVIEDAAFADDADDDPTALDDATEDGEPPRSGSETERRRDLVIPDDPTVLSYLLSGIVQIELPRRQALLEAATTTERLEALVRLLEREVLLLGHRLRLFAPDPRHLRGPRRS